MRFSVEVYIIIGGDKILISLSIKNIFKEIYIVLDEKRSFYERGHMTDGLSFTGEKKLSQGSLFIISFP